MSITSHSWSAKTIQAQFKKWLIKLEIILMVLLHQVSIRRWSLQIKLPVHFTNLNLTFHGPEEEICSPHLENLK